MGYTAGNLELNVLGINQNTYDSINKTVRSLNSLNRAINKMQGVNFGAQGNKIINFFNKLATATNSINAQNIANLATVTKSLSTIPKMDKINWDNMVAGIQKLTVAITPFVNKVKEAEAGLTSLATIMRKRKLNIADANPKNMLMPAMSVYTLLRMGRAMANLVQAGSDYTETLNLWQVAMRNNTEEAEKFIDKLNEAYGISRTLAMNTQAIFRNMLGSLGQISEESAYTISEALVLMSLDFASLYNTTIQNATEKLQSMLAGQVRPIRSAGLDITETTLYMYYQQLGGTKSMRQLNRTEKQLLSILAVFKQMNKAGATGDFEKTLDQYANQSRLLNETLTDIKTWTGLILKDMIQQSGVLVYINATLITINRLLQAYVKSKNIGDENFIDGIFESTEEANDEVDELQGKLLDFDKFRALEDSESDNLAIDSVLLDAFGEYTSMLEDATHTAQQLADTWTSFFLTDNGELTRNAEILLESLSLIAKTLAVIVGIKIGSWVVGVIKQFNKLSTATINLNMFLGTLLLVSFASAIEAFREGNYTLWLFYSAISAVSVALLIYKNYNTICTAVTKIATVANTLYGKSLVFIQATLYKIIPLIAIFAGAFVVFENWDDMSMWQRIVAGVGLATTAIFGLALALGAVQSTLTAGIAAIGITAGIGAIIASIATIKKEASTPVEFHAMGASDIAGGTLFVAGEMGKTEAVYTGGNGKTNVANIKQMEQAFYNALSRHASEGKDTIVVQAYIDSEKVYESTTAKAKSYGNTWAKV